MHTICLFIACLSFRFLNSLGYIVLRLVFVSVRHKFGLSTCAHRIRLKHLSLSDLFTSLLHFMVVPEQWMLLPEVCLATMWELHAHQGAVAKTGNLPLPLVI